MMKKELMSEQVKQDKIYFTVDGPQFNVTGFNPKRAISLVYNPSWSYTEYLAEFKKCLHALYNYELDQTSKYIKFDYHFAEVESNE